MLLHGAMLDTVELIWHGVYAIDLSRHGGSQPWQRMVDKELCELRLGELLDHLSLERVALVGHSMGGGIATGYGLRRPERVS
ncbi:alpha/beta fold hydrolase [Saccharopolyspora sp. NPDC000995]